MPSWGGGGRGQQEGQWAQGHQRSEGQLRTADKYEARAVGKAAFSERWSPLGTISPPPYSLGTFGNVWLSPGRRGALASPG